MDFSLESFVLGAVAGIGAFIVFITIWGVVEEHKDREKIQQNSLDAIMRTITTIQEDMRKMQFDIDVMKSNVDDANA